MAVHLAVDCMGGDAGLSVTIPAVASFLPDHADAKFLLVGQSGPIKEQLCHLRIDSHPSVTVIDAREVVAMDDTVEVALRKKKDSSMRVAANLLKQGEADVLVSAGNTGALMALSRMFLKHFLE